MSVNAALDGVFVQKGLYVLSRVYIHLYVNVLYINSYIKKQYVFLLHNGDLYSIYTLQINKKFLLFLKLLKKHTIQYFTIE